MMKEIKTSDFKGFKPRVDLASSGGVHLFAEIDVYCNEISFILKVFHQSELQYDNLDSAIAAYNHYNS